MSLEAAIHTCWSGDLALSALVPVARLFTGAVRGAVPLPYVVLVREGETVRTHTSSHTEVSDLTVRFEIYVAELDGGKAIADAIRNRFNRQGLALAVGTCLVMQGTSEQEQAATDGTWTIAATYLARVALPVAN